MGDWPQVLLISLVSGSLACLEEADIVEFSVGCDSGVRPKWRKKRMRRLRRKRRKMR